MGAFARFFSWVLRQAGVAVVLGVAGLTALGLWLYVREHVELEQLRLESIRHLTGQTARTRAALADVEARLAGLRAEQARQEDRRREAARLRTDLEAESSGLRRLTADAEQVARNEQRLARLRETEREAAAAAAQAAGQVERTGWERDGLQVALGRFEAQQRRIEAQKSRFARYATVTWERYGRFVLAGVLTWFLAPPLGRLIAYFVVAPFVAARPAVGLGAPAAVRPVVRGAAGAALGVELEPGDTLWVKERYLQASDEGLLRSTRWLLDWRMPFTCLATGLTELVELRNAAPAARLRATCSSQADAHVELAEVTVPAGTGLVLRPSFLAGVVAPAAGRGPRVRRHWRLFSLQSWATGQFRYFEFVGPTKLLLAGSRGVRAETLETAPGGPVAGRRANRDATIGFTPGLAYRPVRAETFWAFFRGQNPLFDDLFEGDGVFLCQQTSAPGDAAGARRFLAECADGLRRIFGL
jgi:hypothetical protein